MFPFAARMFGAICLASTACAATQTSAQAGELQSTYVAVGGATSVPFGWLDFCRRYAGECAARDTVALDVNLTPKAQKAIERINAWVNGNITPTTDMEHWSVIDRWDYPTDGKGDCEDFALLKRKLLIEEGFPRQALLMTVVKDKAGDGHAVLTIKTNKGEFVLDNLHDRVIPWTSTGYRFVKRQSQTDQNVWVSIGEPTSAPAYVSR
mgnify:CR=1 FL=1